MGELDGPYPFEPRQQDILQLRGRISELGFADSPFLVIGVTALQFLGLDDNPGRTDVVTTPEEYDRLRTEQNEMSVPLLGKPDAMNRKLTFNGQQTIHVISRWTPTRLIRGDVTYESMVAETEEVHGIHVVNPIMSIRWLLSLGYKSDKDTVIGAIQSLRTTDEHAARRLTRHANKVWPKSKHTSS
jgi:hypothetical protein